jgi:ribosome maturation factor RimP
MVDESLRPSSSRWWRRRPRAGRRRVAFGRPPGDGGPGPGGVDLEALTDANRVVSSVLDELDPIPGRYTLEVSSPGVERTLRTPAHFVKAIGET